MLLVIVYEPGVSDVRVSVVVRAREKLLGPVTVTAAGAPVGSPVIVTVRDPVVGAGGSLGPSLPEPHEAASNTATATPILRILAPKSGRVFRRLRMGIATGVENEF